ncbi:MAG: family 10 glycosylhydrolase [Melioribacter sp.]|nr:family 10 glycosylhydrolase [Melioribacter sp.]
MFSIRCCLAFILLTFRIVFTQSYHEIRAVWIATNHRLDWPPSTFNIDLQKKALVEILDSIESKNLNTIFFQVRSNGTVLFKSSFEPFSFYIDENGNMPYDPLKFAIEEAHRRNLEIHAWINVVQVFAGKDLKTFNNPLHITKRKPNWIIEYGTIDSRSYWLNPALPEVREYLSDLIKELVENYNVDGVHLDYIRYPGRNLNDDSLYNIYGGGLLKDDWRRKNITDLIELINKKVKSIKPNIKLGATPVGINRNHKDMYGWEGFYEVYQDVKDWLRKGLLDYIAPQVYWSFNDRFQFDILAKDWVDNSFGRKVIIGIGAYKPEVRKEIDKMINYVRAIGADGVAFFRYSSIKDYNLKSLFDSNSNKRQRKKENFNENIESKNIVENNHESEKIEIDEPSFALMNLMAPQLIKKLNYYEIIIYSEKEDEVILKGVNEKNEEIIKIVKVREGKNIINISSNLEKYSEIFLLFISSNKMMKLKL